MKHNQIAHNKDTVKYMIMFVSIIIVSFMLVSSGAAYGINGFLHGLFGMLAGSIFAAIIGYPTNQPKETIELGAALGSIFGIIIFLIEDTNMLIM